MKDDKPQEDQGKEKNTVILLIAIVAIVVISCIISLAYYHPDEAGSVFKELGFPSATKHSR